MKTKTRPSVLVVILVSGLAFLPKATAELPSLDKQPWIGYYAAFASKRFDIGITPHGNIEIRPMNAKGLPVGKKLAINIDAGIEEIPPDGKAVLKQIKIDTLVTEDPATENLEKTSIRGKVTGDAEFELNIEQSRGIIFIGGRVLNPGTLTKNPLRFAVRVNIPNGYPYQEEQPGATSGKGKKSDKKDDDNDKTSKAFLKKIEDDSLQLKWTDGTKVKRDFEKEVDVTAKEINGPGIASAEIEISSYNGKRFAFTASPNSAMTLRNPMPRPLHEGFVICWTADMTKDPQGKSRLAIEVK